MQGLLTIVLLFFICSACSGETPVSVNLNPEAPDSIIPLTPEQQKLSMRLERHFRNLCKTGAFNGAVLVAEKGKVIFRDACGFANFKSREPLTPYSVFQLASVSKMFTAAGIMLLEREGKLNYDSLVCTYIPDFPYPGVTVRHLLNHRSGLPKYMYVSDEKWDRNCNFDNLEMHCMLEEYKPAAFARPGVRFQYENSNYAYLALLVEYLSGQPFELFLRDRIFEPLGMHDTRVYSTITRPDIPAMTKGHIGPKHQPVDETENYINGVVGDKGVYSTIDDLFKFDRALYSEILFDRISLRQAFSPGSPEIPATRDNYGFGWRISPFAADNMVFHYGWWNGYKTCFMRFLNTERTIIVLTNRDRKLLLPREIMEFWWDTVPIGE